MISSSYTASTPRTQLSLSNKTVSTATTAQAQGSHPNAVKFGFEPISTGAAVLGGAGHVVGLLGAIASGVLATVKGCFCFCGCALPLLATTAMLAVAALSRGKAKNV